MLSKYIQSSFCTTYKIEYSYSGFKKKNCKQRNNFSNFDE